MTEFTFFNPWLGPFLFGLFLRKRCESTVHTALITRYVFREHNSQTFHLDGVIYMIIKKFGFFNILASLFIISYLSLGTSAANASTLWRNCSSQSYDDAVQILTEIRDLASTGVFSGYDVIESEVMALDVGFCSGRIAKNDLCSQKNEVLGRYEAAIRELANQGIGSLNARQTLLAWKSDHATNCGSK